METVNTRNVCRSCLGKNESLESVFKIHEDSDISKNYAEIINASISSSVQITPNDGFSDKICSSCSELILKFHKFKINLEKNDQILKSGNFEKTHTTTIQNTKESSDLDDNLQELSTNDSYQIDKILSEDFEDATEWDWKLNQVHHEEDIIDKQKKERYTNPSTVSELIHNAVIAYQEGNTIRENHPQAQEDKASRNVDEAIGEQEIQFKCGHCGQMFVDVSKLEAHLAMQAGKNIFKCKQCNRKFMKRIHLKSHILVYVGFKPFECDYCIQESHRAIFESEWIHRAGTSRDGYYPDENTLRRRSSRRKEHKRV